MDEEKRQGFRKTSKPGLTWLQVATRLHERPLPWVFCQQHFDTSWKPPRSDCRKRLDLLQGLANFSSLDSPGTRELQDAASCNPCLAGVPATIVTPLAGQNHSNDDLETPVTRILSTLKFQIRQIHNEFLVGLYMVGLTSEWAIIRTAKRTFENKKIEKRKLQTSHSMNYIQSRFQQYRYKRMGLNPEYFFVSRHMGLYKGELIPG